MSEKNLHQRLLAIISDLGAIGKDGQYSGGGASFAYHKIDDVVDHLRPLLVKHGVTYTINTVASELREYDHVSYYNGKENHKRGLHSVVTLKAVFFNADDPTQTMEAIAPGDGIDFADKSYGKAVSYALKAILLAVFQLRGQPDNEADGDKHESGRAAETHQPEKPAAETPASKHPAIFAKRDYHPSKETGIEAAESLVKDWKGVVCHHRYKTEDDKLIPVPATPLGEMTPKLIGWYYDHFYVPQDGASDEDWKLRAGLNLWKKEQGGD